MTRPSQPPDPRRLHQVAVLYHRRNDLMYRILRTQDATTERELREQLAKMDAELKLFREEK